jgi:arabinan endo-1,5-alpha-L-arabinosidase
VTSSFLNQRVARGWFGCGAWLLLAGGLAASAGPVVTGPRGSLGIHDPSTIIKSNGRYYTFGTGPGILSKSSADGVVWKDGPAIFSTPPAWVIGAAPGFNGDFWAPDIAVINGKYCLYYSVSSWSSQQSGIGLVTNPTLDPTDPNYLWTDQGIVIQSFNGSSYNTIDPCVTFDANGNPWLAFGSYWNGIYLVQLDPVTGKRITPSSTLYHLAYNSSIEANCLFRRGGYYYLFVNWGSCCSGVNSTYNVRVGRSTSITGPYLDRNGVDLRSSGGTLFLEATGKYAGPGHVGILNENTTTMRAIGHPDTARTALRISISRRCRGRRMTGRF